jgi:hypothetical protein
VSRRILNAIRPALAALLLWPGAVAVRAAGDPESRWLHGYVLAQTGNQLAEQELWPLALANYTAALAQFQDLAGDHPDFQSRLVTYRLSNLKQRIAEAHESMNAGDHDVAMHYADVIETAREGATRRYAFDPEGAFQYLVRAQWQMEELLSHSPEPVVNALKKQRDWIDGIVLASRVDLIRLPDGALKVHNIEKDFALAVSVAMSDLPSFRAAEIEETETGMSSALFPEELVLLVRGQWYR